MVAKLDISTHLSLGIPPRCRYSKHLIIVNVALFKTFVSAPWIELIKMSDNRLDASRDDDDGMNRNDEFEPGFGEQKKGIFIPLAIPFF